jgi:hypothetical protein
MLSISFRSTMYFMGYLRFKNGDVGETYQFTRALRRGEGKTVT